MHRRNVYDCINKLVEKGLINEIFIEGEKYYKAVHPKRLLALLQDREAAVDAAMPEMMRRFQKVEAEEYAHIYKGVSGFRNYLQDILDLPDGEACYYIGAKLGWFDPRLKYVLPRFKSISKQKKLIHYHLFDKEVQERYPEMLKELKEMGAVYKILPKEYSTPSAVDIIGDHVFTFNLTVKRLDDDLTQFVIISERIASMYKIWFTMMWNALPGEKFQKKKK